MWLFHGTSVSIQVNLNASRGPNRNRHNRFDSTHQHSIHAAPWADKHLIYHHLSTDELHRLSERRFKFLIRHIRGLFFFRRMFWMCACRETDDPGCPVMERIYHHHLSSDTSLIGLLKDSFHSCIVHLRACLNDSSFMPSCRSYSSHNFKMIDFLRRLIRMVCKLYQNMVSGRSFGMVWMWM